MLLVYVLFRLSFFAGHTLRGRLESTDAVEESDRLRGSRGGRAVVVVFKDVDVRIYQHACRDRKSGVGLLGEFL